jgi:hypothetical protein
MARGVVRTVVEEDHPRIGWSVEVQVAEALAKGAARVVAEVGEDGRARGLGQSPGGGVHGAPQRLLDP